MRTVFSSNDVSRTVLVRDALEHRGIGATIQNGNFGLTLAPDPLTSAEVWINNDADYELAKQIVDETMTTIDRESDMPPWICGNCKEENPPAFEICWKCGKEKMRSSDHD